MAAIRAKPPSFRTKFTTVQNRMGCSSESHMILVFGVDICKHLKSLKGISALLGKHVARETIRAEILAAAIQRHANPVEPIEITMADAAIVIAKLNPPASAVSVSAAAVEAAPDPSVDGSGPASRVGRPPLRQIDQIVGRKRPREDEDNDENTRACAGVPHFKQRPAHPQDPLEIRPFASAKEGNERVPVELRGGDAGPPYIIRPVPLRCVSSPSQLSTVELSQGDMSGLSGYLAGLGEQGRRCSVRSLSDVLASELELGLGPAVDDNRALLHSLARAVQGVGEIVSSSPQERAILGAFRACALSVVLFLGGDEEGSDRE